MKKFIALAITVALVFSAAAPASADSCWRGRKGDCRVEIGNSNKQVITIKDYTGNTVLSTLLQEAADRFADPTVVALRVVSADPSTAPNTGYCGAGCAPTPNVISVVLADTGQWRFWGDYKNSHDSAGFINGSTISINTNPIDYDNDPSTIRSPYNFNDMWNRGWLMGLLGSALTDIQYFPFACSGGGVDDSIPTTILQDSNGVYHSYCTEGEAAYDPTLGDDNVPWPSCAIPQYLDQCGIDLLNAAYGR